MQVQPMPYPRQHGEDAFRRLTVISYVQVASREAVDEMLYVLLWAPPDLARTFLALGATAERKTTLIGLLLQEPIGRVMYAFDAGLRQSALERRLREERKLAALGEARRPNLRVIRDFQSPPS